jgi:hypothetical protein
MARITKKTMETRMKTVGMIRRNRTTRYRKRGALKKPTTLLDSAAITFYFECF